jgi:uncharacterized Ntn-hydrolase superfamily protein
MTFSIVAYDESTGSLGSAVASRSIAVGGTVAYSRFGVGIVMTQHAAHLGTGQCVLDRMERGTHPQDALQAELSVEVTGDVRQIIAADTGSAMGAWTGDACEGERRHLVADDCAAAGNMLATTDVVDRMLECFHGSRGEPLGDRLIRCLEAGEAAGGDRRGRQAAAVFVLPPPGSRAAINLDLRVDDHPRPLEELRRLYGLFREEHGADAA